MKTEKQSGHTEELRGTSQNMLLDFKPFKKTKRHKVYRSVRRVNYAIQYKLYQM